MTLAGEGIYALSSVKKIEVTDEYLRLDENTRKCQHTEPYDSCTTRKYFEIHQEKCKCASYALRKFGTNQVFPQLLYNN